MISTMRREELEGKLARSCRLTGRDVAYGGEVAAQ